ncbi:MAG: NADH-quinone oxidoreductase subunit L [Thaumarchaeota archaeon]|jgi:NADH-quinone oxidoreductase subunit L|nr:NADH-quinone oxidoreductase subunit L [Candidatus Terraquivivens yellowstonensis]MCL7400416.1 NADH-quinone oxidoreductase subunit L [Candidatus Terraquivivens yellowstonensis]
MLPFAAWLSWLIPIIGSVFVPIVFRLGKRAGEIYPVLTASISAVFSLSMVLDVWGGKVIEERVKWIPLPDGNWIEAGVLADPLSILFASIASFLGTLIILYSIGYMEHEEGLPRYYFFMLFFVGAMVGLVLSNNLLQTYIFWEIVGLCSYALIGFWYRKPSAAHAGIKAFVTTRVGDVAFLIGILLLYKSLGTFSMHEISVGLEELLSNDPNAKGFVIACMLLIFGGAIGKSAQFPLHVWLPDAMEGPTPVSALIHAATMVKAGVYLVARTAFTIVPLEAFGRILAPWYETIATIGAVTAFLAATMGLVMNDIKRVVAYSTISQLGLMFTALGLASELGWFSSQFHVLSHSIFKALLFLSAGAVIHAVHTNNIDEMGGLVRKMPLTFVASLFGAFALSGIPPFSGFFSKDLIIEASLEAGNSIIYLLVVFTSILTVTYTMRWIYKIFLAPPSPESSHAHEAPKVMTVPLLILATLSLLAGFFEEPFTSYIGLHHHFKPSPSAYATSAIILISGLSLAYAFYLSATSRGVPLINPVSVRKGRLGSALHKLLVNRYYIDHAYYKVFVDGTLWLSSKIRRYVEEKVIDGFNYALARAMQSFVQAFRYLQTGSSNVNISGYALGIAILLIIFLLLLFGGVHV